MSLEELRENFANAGSGFFLDEGLQRTARLMAGPGEFRPAPYAGIPSLLDAPVRPMTDETLEQLQLALIGMPMDLGVTNRNGARFGPRALRVIERIGPHNEVLNIAPVHELEVADIGDVPFRSRFHLDKCHEDIEVFIARLVASGVMPFSVGGDHSISHPILRAVGKDAPVGMIHIDAHADTGGIYDEERFHHGAPFRNAVLEGVLDPRRTIQIGIRGSATFSYEFSHLAGMTVVECREVAQMGLPALIEKCRAVVGDGPTYLSFDVDSLDPAYAPGTGTPEPAGLTPHEVLTLLRGLVGVNVVGGDVVEVSPALDPGENTARNAAQVLLEMISLAAFSPSLKGERRA
ncbi:agmatinase [Pseudohalocynthiibacter aestuariivivens]|nr:agmatinase [Pseudohalocynthiibacter aestuariivivens]